MFTTQRERELNELRLDHEGIRAWRTSAGLVNPDMLDGRIYKIMAHMLNAGGAAPSRELLLALYEPIDGLLREALFDFPEVEPGDLYSLDLTQRFEFRKALQRWDTHRRDFDSVSAFVEKHIGIVGSFALSCATELAGQSDGG